MRGMRFGGDHVWEYYASGKDLRIGEKDNNCQGMAREPLNQSSGKRALWVGMGCKARTAAIAVAMARMSNAADRPNPQMHAARGLVQRFPRENAEFSEAWPDDCALTCVTGEWVSRGKLRPA